MDHHSPSLFAILNAMEKAGQERQFSHALREALLIRWKDAPAGDRAKWLDRAARYSRAMRSPGIKELWEKLRV
jgi:hypothetical protein